MSTSFHSSIGMVQGEESGSEQGTVLGHVTSSKGIEVDKAKVDLISSLLPP
jgi:hypothetical protein